MLATKPIHIPVLGLYPVLVLHRRVLSKTLQTQQQTRQKSLVELFRFASGPGCASLSLAAALPHPRGGCGAGRDEDGAQRLADEAYAALKP